jgi:hypothetical protein
MPKSDDLHFVKPSTRPFEMGGERQLRCPGLHIADGIRQRRLIVSIAFAPARLFPRLFSPFHIGKLQWISLWKVVESMRNSLHHIMIPRMTILQASNVLYVMVRVNGSLFHHRHLDKSSDDFQNVLSSRTPLRWLAWKVWEVFVKAVDVTTPTITPFTTQEMVKTCTSFFRNFVMYSHLRRGLNAKRRPSLTWRTSTAFIKFPGIVASSTRWPKALWLDL